MQQIDNEKFGKFITELRKEKNLTQKELADQLFVSDKTVSKWERGASFPNKRILRNNLCLPACRILVYMIMFSQLEK